jgi:hypothetical protein
MRKPFLERCIGVEVVGSVILTLQNMLSSLERHVQFLEKCHIPRMRSMMLDNHDPFSSLRFSIIENM